MRKDVIIKEIDLNELPRKYGIGANKDKLIIDWSNSINYKVKFIYDNIEGKFEIIDYTNGFLTIQYLDNKPFKIRSNNFLKCQFGEILKKKTNKFKIEIGQRIIDYNEDGSVKRDLIIIDRKIETVDYGYQKYNKKLYKYHCNICGFNGGKHYSTRDNEYKNEHWIDESPLLNKTGCACCGINSKIVVEGINDIPTTDSWMIPYFQGGYNEAKKYTYRSNQKIYPVCPDCSRIKDKPMIISNIYQKHSINCPCGDGISYISKYMYNLLEQIKTTNQIKDFQTEMKYDWCIFHNPFKNKNVYGLYDFVIDELKLIIETDGGFHRINNTMNGQTKEESIWIDKIKDTLANNNGYKVIRIVYNDNKKNVKEDMINSRLNNIFDLNNIDWLQCDDFALSNLAKKACNLKYDNPDLTCTEISKIMNINKNTIAEYLKLGTRLKWCFYDPKKESSRTHGKSVEIFKNEQSLGIFKSCTELEQKSEVLFGVKLLKSNIYICCKNKLKNYKGFSFQYITKEQYSNVIN